MIDEVPEPNPPLSSAEASAIAMLSPADVELINSTILCCALSRWQKVAMVVIRTEEKLKARFPQLSYIFYAMRIQDLADRGRLQSQGNLDYMRFSEVRLPHES
jgi:hypothetical protein